MPDEPLHALILMTLLPADLEALCVSLRALAIETPATPLHVAVLAEPLTVATLHTWLVADGRDLQHALVVPEPLPQTGT